MCGICGKFNYGTDRVVEISLLEEMTDVLSHRGPDDKGVFLGKRVGLGHRRLSIIDLSPLGHQPMFNEDNTVALVFNGEIYNYLELRDELVKRGHTFRSRTDTEVIIHAYEEYGADCVKRFNGMFAFAVWDGRKEELLLARDRLGVKPLYYHMDAGSITFASEIKSILADPGISRSTDSQALGNFLTLHYVPGPRTMFKGILKLKPGTLLKASRSGITAESYWELRKENQPRYNGLGENEIADMVYSALKDSVRKRMQSDVPVGALLSGGLDSSAILGLMTELGGTSIPSFTVGYSGSGDDGTSEFKWARKAAAYFKSAHHEAVVDAGTFLDFLPKAVWHQDEPIGEPASIPLYFVSKLARDCGVTVLLTGEGSDELFAGYNRHWGEILSDYYLMMPGFLRESVLGPFIYSLPGSPLLKKGHRSMSIADFNSRYMSWHTVFTEGLKEEVLKGAHDAKDTFEDVFMPIMDKAEGLDNLDRILLLDVNVWLPDDLLMKKDKMGMATSIEARVPFLDYKFVEFAFQLPSSLKVKRLATKYILKKSMERLLPKEIIYRKKEGFPTPISKWFRSELKDFVFETLASEGAMAHGFFDKKAVRKIVDGHMKGIEDNGRLLFPLINFELWHSVFMGNRAETWKRRRPAST